MEYCDLCNATIGAEAKRYPASLMRTAVDSGGLRPSGAAASLGAALGQNYEEVWRQRVMADTTDWALCAYCSGRVEIALLGIGVARPAPTPRPSVPRPHVLTRPPPKPSSHAEGPAPIKVVPCWCIPLWLLLTLGVYHLFWLYRVFKELHGRKATDLSPGKAVGALFLPFFNFAWVFVVWKRLGDAIRKAHAQAGLAQPATGVLWVAPVSVVAAFFLNIVAPFAGVLLAIVTLSLVLCIVQSQMNQLAAATPGEAQGARKPIEAEPASLNQPNAAPQRPGQEELLVMKKVLDQEAARRRQKQGPT